LIPFTFQPRCPKCGERVEPFSGYYDSSSRKVNRTSKDCMVVNNEYYSSEYKCIKEKCPMNYKKAEVSTQRITKTAVSRRRETAQEEMLYSIESVSPGTEFAGTITVVDESFCEQVEERLRKSEIHIGGRATRGFGKVSIVVNKLSGSDTEIDTVDKMKCRIANFNEKMRSLTKSYSFFGSEDIIFQGGYFTIDLQSDALLFDKYLRSTAKLSGRKLQKMLNVSSIINSKAYYSQMTERGTWSFAWKLPKEKEQVVGKGSVFLFQCDDIENIYEPLLKLQEKGIGENQAKGLGRIMICNPFHEEVYCS